MKLDKIRFARLVHLVTQFGFNGTDSEIEAMDNIIDVDVPEVKANPADLNELMRAIHAGEKIAAIKAYRTMTGYGLKKAKDAVEKDWTIIKYTKADLINKINLYSKSDNDHTTISNFINNLY